MDFCRHILKMFRTSVINVSLLIVLLYCLYLFFTCLINVFFSSSREFLNLLIYVWLMVASGLTESFHHSVRDGCWFYLARTPFPSRRHVVCRNQIICFRSSDKNLIEFRTLFFCHRVLHDVDSLIILGLNEGKIILHIDVYFISNTPDCIWQTVSFYCVPT